jgi:hypothetical protein
MIDPRWTSPRMVNHILAEKHYLGPLERGIAWQDQFGIIIVTPPTSRRMPPAWLELARWCITSKEKNAGSRQWAAFARALRKVRPDITTVISYSDPSVGHTGALYRAANWWWAPTWHRLRPPPSGNGSWSSGRQEIKDRWIFALRDDPARARLLIAQDDALLKRYPAAKYREPGGVPFKPVMAMLECGPSPNAKPAASTSPLAS